MEAKEHTAHKGHIRHPIEVTYTKTLSMETNSPRRSSKTSYIVSSRHVGKLFN